MTGNGNCVNLLKLACKNSCIPFSELIFGGFQPFGTTVRAAAASVWRRRTAGRMEVRKGKPQLFSNAFLNLFAEAEFGNDDGGGGGIHIHIEDSVLNALLEKVPWAEVFESLNNKLSRTEETKHIREHIYKVSYCQILWLILLLLFKFQCVGNNTNNNVGT